VGLPPTQQGIKGYKIALEIDGILNSSYNNITDSNGIFRIQNYTIPFSMNIYSSHKIEAKVIGSTPGYVTLNADRSFVARIAQDLTSFRTLLTSLYAGTTQKRI